MPCLALARPCCRGPFRRLKHKPYWILPILETRRGVHWFAGRLLLTGCVAPLERVVGQRLESTEFPAVAVLDVALDALIELGARPEPSLLVKVHDRRPVQALILLSRLGPEGDFALRTVMSKARSESWFATANLLYLRKAPGFAALLLRDLQLTAHVYVSTSGNVSRGSVSRGFGHGDGGIGLAPGYPPWPAYSFGACATSGEVVLVAGPTSVCYQRRVATAGTSPAFTSSERSGPTAQDRLSYFATLAPGLRAEESLAVAWRGEAALKTATARFIDEIRANYGRLIEALVKSSWLTSDEAAALATPDIRVEVVDLRPN